MHQQNTIVIYNETKGGTDSFFIKFLKAQFIEISILEPILISICIVTIYNNIIG